MSCGCDNISLANTGRPNCVPLRKVTSGLLLVPYYNEADAINSIDISGTTTLNQAFFDGLINQADRSKRIHPIMGLKNFESERGEPVFEEFSDRSKKYIAQGARTGKAIIPNVAPSVLAQLNNLCAEIGAFHVDTEGNLIGAEIVDDLLYPVRIAQGTFVARYIDPTDTTVSKVEISWEYHMDEKDEDLQMIPAEDFGSVRLLSLRGVQDAVIVMDAADVTATAIQATVRTTVRNGVGSYVMVKGLVAADFVVYNVTQSASITPTSVTESADGVYDFVIPSQTSADVIRLGISKNGYEADNVTATV